MEGVVPVVSVLLLRKKPIGLSHDQGITGLHAEQEVVVVHVPADVRELKRGLHHAPA